MATAATVAKKKYFHRIHGAKFALPDGQMLTFSAGDGGFETDSPDIQAELDKIANLPASQVYTVRAVEGMEEAQLRRDVDGSALAAFDAANKIPAGTETVPIPVPAQPKPTLTPAAAVGASDASGSSLTAKLAAAKAAVDSAGSAKVSK